MQRSLTMEEYATFFMEVVDSKCVDVIKHYFRGNVDAFYNAPSKFKEWSTEKDFYKREAMYKSAWEGLSHYNFAGLEHKWLKRIFGKNYYNAQFMHKVWDMVKALGYKKVYHGTLPYKGKNDTCSTKHTYPTKYLPPPEKLKEIFKDPELVKRVINPSSYCNKVRKILDAMRDEHLSEEKREMIQKGKGGKSCNFTSPDNLMNKLLLLVKKGNAGTAMSFNSIVEPILTKEYCNYARDFWFNEIPQSIKDKYEGGSLESLMKPEDLKAMYETQLAFIKKIQKQLNGPDALKMFKDEWIGKDKDGNVLWKQADEKRIATAREAVDAKIASLQTWIDLIERNKEDE